MKMRTGKTQQAHMRDKSYVLRIREEAVSIVVQLTKRGNIRETFTQRSFDPWNHNTPTSLNVGEMFNSLMDLFAKCYERSAVVQ